MRPRVKKFFQDERKVKLMYAMIEIGQTIVTTSLRSGADKLRSKGSDGTRNL